MAEGAHVPRGRQWTWQTRFGLVRHRSLGVRILLVNLVALIGFAIGVFYLDSFRERLLATRQAEMISQGSIIAQLLVEEPDAGARIARLALPRATRVRLYRHDGALAADNWSLPGSRQFVLEDPTTEGFRRTTARMLDRFVEVASLGSRIPEWREPAVDRLQSWPDAVAAVATGRPSASVGRAANGAVVLFAAVPVGGRTKARADDRADDLAAILLVSDAGDLVETVRQEREQTFKLFLALLAASLLLSLYLARTIVRPLGELALAAGRVRRGRDRDVEIPRFPERRDEIGRLARSLADMTASLRQRIDATEAFAADVAHELKNPLASLRSAVEALGSVHRPEHRAQLFALISDDVGRIDRLISDISEGARLEAELSRIRLEPVDLAALVRGMAAALGLVTPWSDRLRLHVAAPADGMALVLAEPSRLERVVGNLLDNAASFSPEGGQVTVAVSAGPSLVELRVEDEGPGVHPSLATAIFDRFYSERPEGESYGRHSGLGLSIVRSIIEAFDGDVFVTSRADGASGASFVVRLPRVLATGERLGGVRAAEGARPVVGAVQ
ncbi:stimulus-sensing domain-containing protein [Thermaurantiacus sp.]